MLQWLRRNILLAILAIAFATLNAPAQNTIHVPADQTTIQAGIDAAQNGDTVLVAPGTYHEAINFEGKAITVTSEATSYKEAASTVIEAPLGVAAVMLHSGEPVNAVLNGFTITHETSTDPPDVENGIDLAESSGTMTNNIVSGNPGCAVSAYRSPQLVLQGNQFTDQYQLGNLINQQFECGYKNEAAQQGSEQGFGVGFPAVFLYWCGNVSVVGNLIEDNSSLGLNGIIDEYTQTSVIQGNTIRNNLSGTGADGMGIWAVGPQIVTVVQNLVYDNDKRIPDPPFDQNGETTIGTATGLVVYSPPSDFQNPVTYDSITLTALNNTFFANSSADATSGYDETPFAYNFPAELNLGGNFMATTVANNLFITNQTYNPDVSCIGISATSTISFHNNDIYGPAASYWQDNCATAPGDTGDLAVSPQFLNATSTPYNFRVERTSPVIAAGDVTVSPLPPADLDGKNRTVCGKIDMGAYEKHPIPPITLTSSPNPSVGGTSVTFHASLQGNCNVPTGELTFLDGQTSIGTATLDSSGKATFSTDALFVGTHAITATYPGDFNFDRSTSNAVQQVVTGYPSTISLHIAPNPAEAFQAITFTATVSTSVGKPTGTVSFVSNGQTLTTAPINGTGSAIATISSLGTGNYSITAVYNGSVNYEGSTSTPVEEVVNGAATSTALSSTPNPSTFGQTVTFTAETTEPSSTASPAGTVTFQEGTTILGTSTLSASGTAAFNLSTLPVGSHTITADYGGSTNDNPSVSNTITQVVNPITTTVALTGTPNPAGLGQSVALTATVTSINGIPSTGTITFSDQFGAIGTATVTAGQAKLAATNLTVGTHNIIATYNGTGGYGTATSPTLSELIQSFDFSLTLSPSTITLSSATTGQSTVQITGIGNVPGNISLTAGAMPTYGTLSFDPATKQFTAGGKTTSTLTIRTTQLPQQASLHQPPDEHGNSLPVLLYSFASLPLFLLTRKKRTRHKNIPLLCAALALLSITTLTGCTTQYELLNRVAPGTYTIPITSTDQLSHIAHTATLTLIVTR